MSENKIQTKNPDPTKKGVQIDRAKYDFIKKHMIGILKSDGPMPTMKLIEKMNKTVGGDKEFGGSIGWYSMAVKLDLEARGEIIHDRTSKPALVRVS